MACTFPDTKWCGNRSCRNDDKDTGADKDKDDLTGCPIGYMDAGFKKFNRTWPAADQHLRICKRKMTPDIIGCASGEREPMECPNNLCSADAPDSIKFMRSYCSTNLDSKTCENWALKRPQDHEQILQKECENINSVGKPMCRTFCKNNPGKCPAVHDFCALNPDDPICSCINSTLNKTAGAPPASCFDNKCIQTGYQSLAMNEISKNCPNYINCTQIINAQDGAILEDVNIQQLCSTEIDNARDAANREIQEEQDKHDEWQNPLDIFNQIDRDLMILIIILFLVVIYSYYDGVYYERGLLREYGTR